MLIGFLVENRHITDIFSIREWIKMSNCSFKRDSLCPREHRWWMNIQVLDRRWTHAAQTLEEFLSKVKLVNHQVFFTLKYLKWWIYKLYLGIAQKQEKWLLYGGCKKIKWSADDLKNKSGSLKHKLYIPCLNPVWLLHFCCNLSHFNT